MDATIEVVGYKSKNLKDEADPLLLRIIKGRKIKYVCVSKTVREEIKVCKVQCGNDLKSFVFESKGQVVFTPCR